MSHVRSRLCRAVSAAAAADGYLSEAAVGVFICWASVRTVTAARLLLLV